MKIKRKDLVLYTNGWPIRDFSLSPSDGRHTLHNVYVDLAKELGLKGHKLVDTWIRYRGFVLIDVAQDKYLITPKDTSAEIFGKCQRFQKDLKDELRKLNNLLNFPEVDTGGPTVSSPWPYVYMTTIILTLIIGALLYYA